jgi:hypothetical protein
MKRPCEQIRSEGNRKFKTYSYVVTACEIDGDRVMAERLDGFTSKYDANFRTAMEKAFPPDQWTIKGILRLYSSDFSKGGTA